MAWQLILVPAVFAAAFVTGWLLLRVFAPRGGRLGGGAGKGPALVESKSEPRLADMLRYPRSAPMLVRTAHCARGFLPRRRFGQLCRAYWTTDPARIVWAFYRTKLPDWIENRSVSAGLELIDPRNARAISVTQQADRTVIEFSLAPQSLAR